MTLIPKNIGRFILAGLIGLLIGSIWGKASTPKLPIYHLEVKNNYLDTEKNRIYEEICNTGNQTLYNLLMVLSKYDENGQQIPISYYDLAEKLEPDESILCSFKKLNTFCNIRYHYTTKQDYNCNLQIVGTDEENLRRTPDYSSNDNIITVLPEGAKLIRLAKNVTLASDSTVTTIKWFKLKTTDENFAHGALVFG